MPEIQECYCSGLQLQDFYEANSEADWHVLALYCDATTDEPKAPGSRHERGLVDKLTTSSKVQRGNTSHQTPLWPPFLADHARPAGFQMQDLVLTKVLYTSRSIVLNFGRCWFQLQYLTHTSIQTYRRAYWEVLKETSYIGDGDMKMRNFRIGLAFEFTDFVVAFVSHDQVFQVTWSLTESGLAHHDLHVLDQWDNVLARIATWCETYYVAGRKRGKRLAMHVLRFTGDVWFGIGVYTVCEIFFLAGISPYLREQEVFGNPSRLARLVLAYYTFVYKAVRKTWPRRVKPCIRDGVMAPTVDERLRVGNTMCVWAKDKAGVSQRQSNVIAGHAHADAAWASDDELFDPFEPTFMRAALERSPHLGRIVFGETWPSIASAELSSPGCPPDVLTAFLMKFESRSKSTHLNITTLTPLFLPEKDLCARRALTYRYQVGGKGVWSVVAAPRERQFKRTDKTENLFRYIVLNTAKVAVGPLEYCANAEAIRKPSKIGTRKNGAQFYVLPSRGALPSHVPLSLARRNLKHLERRKAMTPEARAKRKAAAQAAKVKADIQAKKAKARAQKAAAKGKGKSKSKTPTRTVQTGNTSLTAQQRKAREAQMNIFNKQPHILMRVQETSASSIVQSNENATLDSDVAVLVKTVKRRIRADQEVISNQVVIQETSRPRRSNGLVLNTKEHPDDAALGIMHRRKRSRLT
ncbi:uncharacterized protein B0H18DRAFT_1106941 [Fomitopsis serialis]|uniref:uncharacterized protein n=1 Tax=Fomitopsis serialis TaxID=139415 RepID=UPI002008367D|nr:uncharacterized protein B0H18DRAFT_1106941 [Neoantrodia serialis]KAH9918448.1 hypothetical protein B0H18DRAFT_1106941 [Neoantrodia serialis]